MAPAAAASAAAAAAEEEEAEEAKPPALEKRASTVGDVYVKEANKLNAAADAKLAEAEAARQLETDAKREVARETAAKVLTAWGHKVAAVWHEKHLAHDRLEKAVAVAEEAEAARLAAVAQVEEEVKEVKELEAKAKADLLEAYTDEARKKAERVLEKAVHAKHVFKERKMAILAAHAATEKAALDKEQGFREEAAMRTISRVVGHRHAFIETPSMTLH